jgi:hypothetical protein
MPPLSDEAPAVSSSSPTASGPTEAKATADLEALMELEKKFWALMRILARRGLVTKEEFLNELKWQEEGR